MFTGIVESTGTIVETRVAAGGRRVRVDVGSMAGECRGGDSVCIQGVCLTVAGAEGTTLVFDVVRETLDRTTLGRKEVGDRVNLERSLRVGDRLDGHIVQGHIDGRAVVEGMTVVGGDHVVRFCADENLSPYLIPKGSIALDGVSLTLVEPRERRFSVALIPTTLERTTLGSLRVGDEVNVETDFMVRTIVHRLDEISCGNRVTTAKAGLA